MEPDRFEFERHSQAVVEFFRRDLGWPLDATNHQDIFRIRETYQNSGGEFWVKLRGDRIAATVGVQRWDEETALLRRFYVLPMLKGRGFGFRLFKKALAYVRSQEYKRVWLWMPRNSTPDARRLYEHFGFKEIESLPVPESADKVCMELEL